MALHLATLPLGLALALVPVAAGAESAPPQRPNQEVFVTQSTSGQEIRGRLLELSSQTLAILVDNRRIELPIEQVLRIDVRGDSLKNGTIIGAVVMGGLATFGCAQGFARSSECAAAIVTNTGLGALMGAGIDALNKGRSTIYAKPAPSTQPIVAAGPRVLFKLRF